MKLRGKLVLSCVIAIAATLGGLLIYDTLARHRAASELLVEIVGHDLPALRERCLADPATFGGALGPRGHRGPHGRPPHGPPDDGGRRPRPIVIHAYDASLRARHPDAPRVPDALVAALGDGSTAIADVSWWGDDVAALMRGDEGDAGPCTYFYARGSTGNWGAVLPRGPLWLLPSLVVLSATVLVAGPLVRRIRRLTTAVERSASAGYASDVDDRGNDEVGELSRAFAAASRRIRAELHEREVRERALREFVANTTHDLMIPLTVLQGHLASLRDGAGDPDAAREARNEAHYMASLVHNLAAAAKLDVADAVVHRSPIDLREVVTRVAARHRPIAREAGVELVEAVPDTPVLADADVTLVEQVVSNLTYNAVRYNRRGGHVAVVLEVLDDRRFSVRVCDDGPGIPDGELERLATRGARSDAARARAPEGQGLGLHIAFRVAALHGFDLRLGPNEGGGLEAVLSGDVRA